MKPDKWLEHDARHIAQGSFGTPYFLADFANRVLALIGAVTEPEATYLRKDIALQDEVACRNDGHEGLILDGGAGKET